MKKKILHEKLGDWVKVIEKAFILTIVFEAFLIIVIGVASNHIDRTSSIWWYMMLIVGGFAYTVLLILKTWYQWKFPGSIIEELIAKDELIEKNKLFERQKGLNELIKETIQGLNVQTCSISNQYTVDNLCNQGMHDGLNGLLYPIINATDVIFDTSNTKRFELGVYLSSFGRFPDDYTSVKTTVDPNFPDVREFQDNSLVTSSGIISLKSDLGLSELSPPNLLELIGIPGAAFEIQSSIRRCMNNMKMDVSKFSHDGIEYSILSSVIFEACSDDSPLGAMYCIYQADLTLPDDIEGVLKIFNAVTANFAFKYDNCITSEIIRRLDNLAAQPPAPALPGAQQVITPTNGHQSVPTP